MKTMQNERVFFISKKSYLPGNIDARVVGNKAYGLVRMSAAGLPVPPAVVLGTGFCFDFFDNNEQVSSGFKELLISNIRHIENISGLTFGGSRKPLLISVRSGAPVSMPGMMETILNIGLCEKSVHGLIRMTGNPRMVWDTYRRLIVGVATIVYHCSKHPFDEILEEHLKKAKVDSVYMLDSLSLKKLTISFLSCFKNLTTFDFSQDPYEQLEKSVIAVFYSWNSKKAKEYRKINKLVNLPGTAVTIQQMVFGNFGGTSGSGVAFTRDPATGEDKIYLDFVFNAQGEDIVSGKNFIDNQYKLKTILPDIYDEIKNIKAKLENEFKDMQEFEFTIADEKLYLLQTRRGKRTDYASLHIAIDMVKEKLISIKEALKRISHIDLEKIKKVSINKGSLHKILGYATPASYGIISGKIAFDKETALKYKNERESVILIKDGILTEDISILNLVDGILTAKGGKTSHAAVVARELNKVCLVGCDSITINPDKGFCLFSDTKVYEGDYICMDGNSGYIYLGNPEITIERPEEYLEKVRKWKREFGKV